MNAFQAVVFDLDGTLIDSIPDVVAAMNQLLVEEGRRPISLDEGKSMVGEGPGPMIRDAVALTGVPVEAVRIPAMVERYIAFYRATPADHTIVYPGVRNVLEQLADDGIVMGVCTNKPHEMSNLVLEALGMGHFFRTVIGGDALPIRKPDAGHVLAVLDGMNVSASAAAFVGDSPTDMKAARNAGLPSVAVSYGYSIVGPGNLDADILISEFAELPDALAQLANGRN